MALSNWDFFLIILAIILPPVPVFYKCGCGIDLLINILLCLLGAFPGMVHSVYMVFKYNEVDGYQRLVSQDAAAV